MTAAESGITALAYITEPYDAAVMDYELPDLSGDALAQLLSNVQPRLPIILFSGRVEIPSNSSHQFAAIVVKGSPMASLLDTLADLIQENAEPVPWYDGL